MEKQIAEILIKIGEIQNSIKGSSSEWYQNPTIIVGLLTFAGVMIQLLATWLMNNKNKKSQAEIQGQNNDILEKWKQINLDATLKASPRLKWIDEVRLATHNHISNIYDEIQLNQELIYKLNEYKTVNKQMTGARGGEGHEVHFKRVKTERDKLIEIINLKKVEILNTTELLLLYFSEQDEHNEIQKAVEFAYDEIQKKAGSYNAGITNNIDSLNKDLEENAKNIRKLIRSYNKEQWEKAKKGE